MEVSPGKRLPNESQVGSRALGDLFSISTEQRDILSRMKNCSASDHLLECRYSLHLQDIILSDEIQTQKRQKKDIQPCKFRMCDLPSPCIQDTF